MTRSISTRWYVGLCLAMGAALMPDRATAEVKTITIVSTSAFANGQSFGDIGPYEEITGVITGEIDPGDPRNALITDIELAPKTATGRVAYRTTFTIRKPVDMRKASGVLFYNIVNRGNHNGPNTWHVGGDPGEDLVRRRYLLPEDAVRLMKQLLSDLESSNLFSK